MKKEAPAFEVGGVQATYQFGESEEAKVKRVAIKVTASPPIYLHVLLCLLMSYSVAGAFTGLNGVPFARQKELLEYYGMALSFYLQHLMSIPNNVLFNVIKATDELCRDSWGDAMRDCGCTLLEAMRSKLAETKQAWIMART